MRPYNVCCPPCTSLAFSLHRAVGYIPGVVLYPVVTWFLLTITIGYWAVVAMYPYTPELFFCGFGNASWNDCVVNRSSNGTNAHVVMYNVHARKYVHCTCTFHSTTDCITHVHVHVVMYTH